MSAERIIVTRTDRLGDVLLALPALQYLRRALKTSSIEFVCQPVLFDVLRPFFDEYAITAVDPSHIVWKGAEAALLLHSEASLCLEVWKARVPLRSGPWSRPASFLFLNRGLRQKRSLAEKNEGQYNLDLAEHFVKCLTGEKVSIERTPITLDSDDVSAAGARKIANCLGVDEGKFVVLHPGMGGSAENLPAKEYSAIAKRWLSAGVPVVLSQGPADRDEELCRDILLETPQAKLLKGVSLSVLREVFRRANLVIAPSTGPLHLAHYVGTRTLGFYSKVQSQRKERWEPWGGTGESRVLSCVGFQSDIFGLDPLMKGS